jgi:hypothetical protein
MAGDPMPTALPPPEKGEEQPPPAVTDLVVVPQPDESVRSLSGASSSIFWRALLLPTSSIFAVVEGSA